MGRAIHASKLVPRIAGTSAPRRRPLAGFSRLTLFTPLVLFALALPSSTAAAPGDVTTLLTRLRADILSSTSTSSAESYRASQRTNGCWTDIDYADRSKTGWAPNQHLLRTRSMAAAYHTPNHAGYQSATMRTAVVQAIDCWVAQAPENDGWWWNDVGKQLQIGPIGILMSSDLDTTRRAALIAELPTTATRTGQNRVWTAQGVVHRGLLEQDEGRIRTGLAGITSTIVVGTGEGIQPDWSFHQHGPQLYSAGYGLGFIRDTAYWASRSRDTAFAFTRTEIDTLVSLLLDGHRWMVRGSMFDYSANGRNISRKGTSSSGLLRPCEDLAPMDEHRTSEIVALREHIERATGTSIVGNRHFWRSDFMAHQRPSFYASVKMCSQRTVGTESINDENILGFWLPFGLTYIARRGDEYKEIFPVWDWTLLPGVTAPAWTRRPGNETQDVAFVGGVSNGSFGVAAMILDKASTSARKSWFFFDDEMVALGAGIGSTHAKPIRTALNQCLLRGPVTADGVALPEGRHSLTSAQWVHHDGVGYILPDNRPLELENGPRSGSWQLINPANGSANPVTHDVFTLWLDHGLQPQGQRYRYIVLPKTSPAEVANYAANPPIRQLVNSSAIQGVRHDSLLVAGVVFYEPGQVELHAGLTVEADQPCVVLVDESEAAPIITAADPTAELTQLTVVLKRPHVADEHLPFLFPAAAQAGISVTKASQVRQTPDGGSAPSPVDDVLDAGPADSTPDAETAESIGSDTPDGTTGSDTPDGTIGSNSPIAKQDDVTTIQRGAPPQATPAADGDRVLVSGCGTTGGRAPLAERTTLIALLLLALLRKRRKTQGIS